MKKHRTQARSKKSPQKAAASATARGKSARKARAVASVRTKASSAPVAQPDSKAKPLSARSPIYEAEFLRGLTPLVLRELESRPRLTVVSAGEDAISFSYGGDIRYVLRSSLLVAVYRLDTYNVPRPKALLGDQHFRALSESINDVLALHPPGSYKSFRFGAAGSDSPTFLRLAEAIAKKTSLRHDPEAGDLVLRFRPNGTSWQVLTRLTPRPLSARAYRVCNLKGGLNATLAAAINKSLGLQAQDRYLNAMCGSGTLLIERVLQAEVATAAGIDIDEAALACARENVAAAGLAGQVTLIKADATRLDVEDASFDVITADVPWGDAVGNHQTNAELYPAFLKEVYRIAAAGARFGLLTHELRLFERVLAAQDDWQLQRDWQVWHGGHNPKLYVLKKR